MVSMLISDAVDRGFNHGSIKVVFVVSPIRMKEQRPNKVINIIKVKEQRLVGSE